jgi:hypothetical protein
VNWLSGVHYTELSLCYTLKEILCAELCPIMEDGCVAEGKIYSIEPDALLMTRHKTNQKQILKCCQKRLKSQSCG